MPRHELGADPAWSSSSAFAPEGSARSAITHPTAASVEGIIMAPPIPMPARAAISMPTEPENAVQVEPAASRRRAMGLAAHDQHRAVRVMDAVLADRAEQRVGEAPVAAAADHEQICVGRGL